MNRTKAASRTNSSNMAKWSKMLTALALAASGATAAWAGPAAGFYIVDQQTPGTAGVPYGFSAQAIDANGQGAFAYVGTVHFSTNDPTAVLPSDYTFTAADHGYHYFPVTFLTAGPATRPVTVSDTSAPSITGTDLFHEVIVPNAPAALKVFGNSPQQAGVPFQFSVATFDAYNNQTSFAGTVHFTSNDPLAVLPPNYTFTSADLYGQHNYFNVTLLTPGADSIVATDVANASITGQAQINVSAVPEPASWALMLAGCAVIASVLTRRHQ